MKTPDPPTVEELRRYLAPSTVAVDPGESVGIAYTQTDPAREGYTTLTLAYNEALLWFNAIVTSRQVQRLIIEEYRIYPGKMAVHVGNTIPTAECIGAFKWIAYLGGLVTEEVTAYQKLPMRARLAEFGIDLLGDTEHARDAELHLWCDALRHYSPT